MLGTELLKRAMKSLAPPPKLTVSEWADRHRMLSAESSAEPGPWRTARAPYLRGVMDALSDPAIEEIVVMASAQVGKTECLNNVVGYFIDQDPSPMLWVMPTIELGEAWSKERLEPMCRDTPCLRGKISDVRDSRKGPTSTIRNKAFPGGRLTIAGANKPASLSSKPIRVVLCDEVDKFPPSAGPEGDPVNLAKKRTTTFWNRKVLLTSTPTVRGISRIEAAYEASDKRRFYVPCPHCNELQVLKFDQLQYDGRGTDHPDPETTVYACEHCGCVLTDQDKPGMLARGQWIAEKPGGRIAGFHINELYSPWVRWGEMVRDYLEKKDHPETHKTFINASLGETYEEEHEAVEWEALSARAEDFGAKIPAGVAVITAGIDVQGDRLEVEVVGWGRMEESWSIEYRRLYGDTSKDKVWRELDAFLDTRYRHELGIDLPIATAMVDSGFRTTEVYKFVKGKEHRRIWAGKGVSGFGRAAVTRPQKNNRGKVQLVPIGVDTIKERVFACLSLQEPGAGYCHFSKQHDAEYFQQLTAEKLVRVYEHGRPARRFDLPRGKRNEALDCRVYAYAALANLTTHTFRMLEREAVRIERQTAELREQQKEMVREAVNAAVDAMNEKRRQEGLPPVAAQKLEQPEPAKPTAPPRPRIRIRKNTWI